ncbi:MAG: ribonuclease HII [Aerococcus sp.]|nr:ribonuclease HII [Aerococcus sp.]
MSEQHPLANATVSMLRAKINENPTTLSEEWLSWLASDPRKGVQQLYRQYQKQQAQIKAEKEAVRALRAYEDQLRQQGYQAICGVDEVGRGPLAGPVVTCAVILPEDLPPFHFDDSKQLSHKKRQELVRAIDHYAVSVKIAVVDNTVIDQINILEATKQAMTESIQALDPKADYVLTDAVHLPLIDQPQENWIHGDARLYSVAAASIYAKEYRDNLMTQYAQKYPEYGFERNAGYGTKEHLLALEKYGPTPIHRLSFAPVKAAQNRAHR